MKPGAAIVDVAIDQGGCVETSRPTTYHEPIYIEEEVVHCCVRNLPAAVSQTAVWDGVSYTICSGNNRAAPELWNFQYFPSLLFYVDKIMKYCSYIYWWWLNVKTICNLMVCQGVKKQFQLLSEPNIANGKLAKGFPPSFFCFNLAVHFFLIIAFCT